MCSDLLYFTMPLARAQRGFGAAQRRFHAECLALWDVLGYTEIQREVFGMKSVKPGRGPSMMSGVGSVAAIVFGVIWTLAAVAMGAPFFFPLFGVVFIGIGVAQAVYHFRNATGENRYSSFDIVDDGEEPDPLEQRFGAQRIQQPQESPCDAGFCPYCGARAAAGYEYCRKCGKKLPD